MANPLPLFVSEHLTTFRRSLLLIAFFASKKVLSSLPSSTTIISYLFPTSSNTLIVSSMVFEILSLSLYAGIITDIFPLKFSN